MKKLVLFALTLVCLFCFTSASAQSFAFEDASLQFQLSDRAYSLITPDNLHLHPEWVSRQGCTQEELAAQWKTDGVLVCAVTLKDDLHITVSAVKDDQSVRIFDVDQQTTETRNNYKTSYAKNKILQDEGYTFQSAEWKNTDSGRFLLVKYKQEQDGETASGYMYRTVRNGYQVTIDYRVTGRNVKKADLSTLEDILDTVSFTAVLDKPATSVPSIVLTSVPPEETNSNKFTVAGTCDPGLKLTGVLLRMSSPDPIIITDTANKSGKFSMDVKLPEEGVWLMTLTVQSGDIVTEEIVFTTTTYKKTLLPVNLTTTIPAVTYDDKLVISGTTLQGVSVQCLSGLDFAKTITVNGTQKFTFNLDTSEPGEYDITLVFSKRKLDTRRFTFTVTRIVTEEQQREKWREEAVKPAYNTLNSKLKGYTGRTMGYSLYVVDYWQREDDWIIRMAMTKKNSGYSNIVYVISPEEPVFDRDTQQMMYGECIGSLDVMLPDGTVETCPAFDLLFWD